MNALPADLEQQLQAAAPGGIAFTQKTDSKGVTVAWCELVDKGDLLGVAGRIKAMSGRLSTITAFQPKPPEADDEEEAEEGEDAKEPVVPTSLGGVVIDGKSYELAYHFDLDGDTLTLKVFVPVGGDVDSLTPLFRNADWVEREFMETYAIGVKNHPDPRRLFLDESIDPAVLERLIPFSTLVNAASTKALWEKIIAQKGSEA
jgi:NADH:ubiquinone oxidoreductase subunit C